VQGEVLGGTDGSRNQTWTLASTPVIAGSVRIEIDDGTGPTNWEVRPDLLDAGRDDQVLALTPGSGELVAGDGVHGSVPVANPRNPDANVVAVEYRYGGGTRGNVPAGAITALLSVVDGIDSGKVTNLFPATGGRDEERLDDAKGRARRSIRAQNRAVTVEDFEALAKQAGDVARAKAFPLMHFDPIIGGDEGAGWGFGETVRCSKVYQRIFSVDGVDSVETLTINLDGDDFPECRDVPIDANALLFSGEHQLEVRLAATEAAA
jgi:Baseplate J-like protein